MDRLERAQVALLLHVTPETVDCMPAQDVSDILEIHAANNELQAWQMKKRRR